MLGAFLNFLFGKRESSAQVAKGRLLFTIAHERANCTAPDYFVQLQGDLIQLISKYIHTNPQDVQIQRNRQENAEILNIILPEKRAEETASMPVSSQGIFARWRAKKPKTANIAKERLLIMIAKNSAGAQMDYFPRLQQEIMNLIANDLSIDPMRIKIYREQQSGCEILNIVLPDRIS